MAVVYHWKHGWIPLDHAAALSKSKGNHEAAARMLSDANVGGINSRQDVAKAVRDLPNVSASDHPSAMMQLRQAAEHHNSTDILPGKKNANFNASPSATPWHPMTDGSRWRETPAGLVMERGNREIHLLGTSVNSQREAKRLVAEHSFDRLFKSAKRSPGQKNSAFIKL